MSLPGIAFEIVKSSEPALGIRTDRTALLALCARGPVEVPVTVHSLPEFHQRFGCDFAGALGELAAVGYFANGGSELIVARFAPAEAKAAGGTLGVVGASPPQPPPPPDPVPIELKLRARERGAFGNQIRVETRITVRKQARGVASAAREVTFTGLSAPVLSSAEVGLPVRASAGSAVQFSRVLSVGSLSMGEQVVSLAPGEPEHDLTPGEPVLLSVYEPTFNLRIREPGRADVWVSGLDLRDAAAAEVLLAATSITPDWTNTAGTELPLPGVTMVFAGGDDGLELGGDSAELAASFERALVALEALDTPDLVIAPDLWSRTLRSKGVERLAFEPSAAIALADRMVHGAAILADRVVLLDPPLGGIGGTRPYGVSELAAWYAERAAALGAARDYAACYTPWPRVVAGPVYQGDDTLLVPPSAYVAGGMAQSSRERGPWVAYGNRTLERCIGLAQNLSQADELALQELGINPLRVTLPRGVTVQGVRSLSFPDRKPWAFISTRRLFNFLRRALLPIGLSYVFEPNAPATWVELRRDVERFLRDLYGRGGLAGSTPEQAYFVQVDAALNPEPARESGVLTCRIGVAPAVPLEFLLVRLELVRGVARVVQEPNVP